MKILNQVYNKVFIQPWIGTKALNKLADVFLRGDGFILMFHSVTNEKQQSRLRFNRSLSVSKRNFERILLYLREKGYHFVSMDDIYDFLNFGKKIEHPFVAITFDDGYLDNYLNAYPILKKYHIPFVIYTAISFLNKSDSMWWFLLEDLLYSRNEIQFTYKEQVYTFYLNDKNRFDVFLSLRKIIMNSKIDVMLLKILFEDNGIDIDKYKELGMGWDTAKLMAGDGIATIGAHTLTHQMLSALDANEVIHEVSLAKQSIEEQLGISVEHFAYPFGDIEAVSEKVISLVSTVGFKTAVTTNVNHVYKKENNDIYLMRLPRIFVGDEIEQFIPRFQADCSGLNPFIQNTWKGLKSRDMFRKSVCPFT
jgi:peptidoglycan/xylan/chitin deacetylase (PgdA/CDA1 family)